jgi:hypothetical protein
MSAKERAKLKKAFQNGEAIESNYHGNSSTEGWCKTLCDAEFDNFRLVFRREDEKFNQHLTMKEEVGFLRAKVAQLEKKLADIKAL